MTFRVVSAELFLVLWVGDELRDADDLLALLLLLSDVVGTQHYFVWGISRHAINKSNDHTNMLLLAVKQSVRQY